MDEIIKIWDIIVKSNTFNFAILVIIFAIAANKLNLGEKIEHIKSEIIKSIENAKSEKENAVKFLQKAQSDVANLDNEVHERLNKAELQAKHTARQIMEAAGEKAARYEAGILRAIEAEEKTAAASLSKQTAKASVELAKEHIKQTLNNNPELHAKFINEGIDELDRIKLL